MRSMQALVGVSFVDQHKLRSTLRTNSDAEQAGKTSRGETLVQHLGGSEENIRRFIQHAPPCESDLIRFHHCVTPRIAADQALELPLNVTLEPHHRGTALRAANKWALVGDRAANRKLGPRAKAPR